jgi:hypothetical protein
MPTERQVLDTVAQCVVVMACYYDNGWTKESAARMVAEIELVAAWVVEGLKISPSDTNQIIGPVQSEIDEWYGPELGPRLSGEFAKVFQDAAGRFSSAGIGQNGDIEPPVPAHTD